MPRAQTSLDFLVGTTVFLLTLSAVLVTIPGIIDPFATGREAGTITADRAAESLATDVLVESTGDPFHFTDPAVTQFFGLTVEDATDKLGIPASVNLNVTLIDADGQQIHSLGQPVPVDTADVSTAWRAGLYEGEPVELLVRVW